MGRALGEAQAGIEHDTIEVYPGLCQGGETIRKLRADVRDDIVVGREVFHHVARPSPVHGDVGDIAGCKPGQHVRISATAAHVVDDDSTGRHAGRGDLRAHGVDAHVHPVGDQGLHDGQHAITLLLDTDADGTGPGRLPADIDKVRSLVTQSTTALDSARGIGPAATVGEGIGSDVEDAHDKCAIEISEGRRQAARCAHR